MNEDLKILYKELKERIEYLEILIQDKETTELKYRLAECNLMQIKIGQLLFNNLTDEMFKLDKE